jgi:hypothetical protein
MNIIIFIISHWWLWLILTPVLYFISSILIAIGKKYIVFDIPISDKVYLILPSLLLYYLSIMLFITGLISFTVMLIKFVISK